MRCAVFLLCGWVFGVSALFGNGGGYFRGGVEKTGDLAGFEPKETDKIRMLDEKLTIRLGRKEADVEVRYVMKNVTDKKVTVRFGFPVEESFDNYYDFHPSETKAQDGKRLAYCKNYQITASGKPVKAKWEKERITSDPQFKGVAGWMVSEVSFGAMEEKPVVIQFQSVYPDEEDSVSDSSVHSAAIFRYRLSTAACWAGSIGTGRVVIEPAGVNSEFVRVLKPVNRFKKEGNRWVWNFEELEPTLADDMEIEAVPGQHLEQGRKSNGDHSDGETPPHQLVDFLERGGKWSMLHSNYQVKASSTLKAEGNLSYAPEVLREWWGSKQSAWSEGASGPGVGEWLEITPVEAKPLLALEMKPGYQKGDLFKANARPKKVRIELNGEHAFDADVPNRQEEVEIPVIGYAKPVRKIRMTFSEVYPGEKFEDLCVTSIRLHVRLDKKPKIAPSR